MTRTVSPSAQQVRENDCKEADASALRAIAQATVNVELFTVPLYMSTLYSIQGTHQITGKDEDYYKDRLWPGPATTANPKTANERAFNLVYSVFIEEMLHLQLAANIASALGVSPVFTSAALQKPDHGWTCYGPGETTIPHIIDLRDTIHYDKVKVDIAALTAEQIKLFMAIEQPEADAQKGIKKSVLEKKKYFPSVPFAGWTKDKAEKDLPMFGTIGWMYQCYYDYMKLRYKDGTDLWQHVFRAGSVQNDLFNVESSGHPKREYFQFSTTVTANEHAAALHQVVTMMNAITDQGEGSELKERAEYYTVQDRYQALRPALEADYPRYTDTGTRAPSADAAARHDNGAKDHYERFTELRGLVGQVQTWPAWREGRPSWKAEDLQTEHYDPKVNPYQLPSTQAIADAMNRAAADEDTRTLINKAVVGAIAGVTTVLDDYWKAPGTSFPYPSMVGSGDRMAIYWALYGAAPDLSVGVGEPDGNALSHACQGLDLDKQDRDNCAAVEIFHTCRGSNKCKAQGGCGFVQKTGGGGQCGSVLVAAKSDGDEPAGDEEPPLYSPPSDNKCGTFGGCAVPISASQVFPKGGTMQLYDFVGEEHAATPFDRLSFQKGEKVHDVAYRAYRAVMKERGKEVPADPPAPNDRRLVFPPST
jgi:hypothetical protein